MKHLNCKSVRLQKALMLTLFLLLTSIPFTLSAQGTWTALNNLSPQANSGILIPLPDGSVLCRTAAGGGVGKTFNRLTPTASNSYQAGTWSSIANMINDRKRFSSQILRNGKLYVCGGETGAGSSLGEVYTLQSNSWSATGAPGALVSDANSEILDNGKVLQFFGSTSSHTCKLYDPVSNTYAAAGNTIGIHTDATIHKLNDGSVLLVDRVIGSGTVNTERYFPSTNSWVVEPFIPFELWSAIGSALGSSVMLPDGKLFFVGGNGNTALYTPSGTSLPGTWTAGPTLPGGYAQPNGPIAMARDGIVLFTASPIPIAGNTHQNPTRFYEYNYQTNLLTQINGPTGLTLPLNTSNQTHLANLANGQILLGIEGSTQYYLYNPAGSNLSSFRGTTTAHDANCTHFILYGTKFNGKSLGSGEGGEGQNSTNFPIVRLSNGPTVYFCRTFNWNSTLTNRTSADTVEFELPAGIPNGVYNLATITNGVNSLNSYSFSTYPQITGVTSYTLCSGEPFTYSPTYDRGCVTATWTRPFVSGISNTAITTAQSGMIHETLINTTTTAKLVTYPFIISNQGFADTVNITVTVNPKPTVAISPFNFCATGFPQTLTASGASSYNWTPGTTGTTQLVTPITKTNYRVIGTNSLGCKDTAYATARSLPTVSATAVDPILCPGQSTLIHSVAASVETDSLVSDPMGITVTEAQVFNVTAAKTITLTQLKLRSNGTQLKIWYKAGGYGNTNLNSSAGWTQLGGTLTYTPAVGLSYTTINLSTPLTITAGQTFGIVIASNGGNMQAFVSETSGSTFAENADMSISVGHSGSGFSGSFSLNNPNRVTDCGWVYTINHAINSYLWQPSAGLNNISLASPTASPASTTTYTVIAQDANLCTNTSSVIVSRHLNPSAGSLSASADTVCPGSTANLIAGASLINDTLNTALNNMFSSTGISFTLQSIHTSRIEAFRIHTINNPMQIEIWYRPGGFSSPVAIGNGWIKLGSTISVNGQGPGNFTLLTPSTFLNLPAGQLMGIALISSVPASLLSTNTTQPLQSLITQNNDISIYTGMFSVSPNVYSMNTSPISWNGSVIYEVTDFSYVWQPLSLISGSNTSSGIVAIPPVTTTYTVTASSAHGCTLTMTKTLQVFTPPGGTVSLNPSLVCPGDSAILMVSPSGSIATANWLPAAGLSVSNTLSIKASPASNTVYTLTLTDTKGCTGTLTAPVRVYSPPLGSPSATPGTLCQGTPVTLNYTVPSGNQCLGIPVNGFTGLYAPANWTQTSSNAIGSSINTSGAPNQIILTGGSGLSEGFINYSITIPCHGIVSFDWITANTTDATGEHDYPMYSIDGGANLLFPGYNNTAGYPAIQQGKANILLSAGQTLTLTLRSSISFGQGSVTVSNFKAPGFSILSQFINWYTVPVGGSLVGNTLPAVVNPTTSVTYFAQITTAPGGCIHPVRLATNPVTVNQTPALNISASATTLCNGNSSTLTATGADNYLWQPGNLSGSSILVTPGQTTTYTITGTNANGCSQTSTITITVNPKPVIIGTASPSIVCPGGNVTLSATTPNVTWLWQPGNHTGATVVVNPQFSTVYTVVATSVHGCTRTETFMILTHPTPTVTISATPDDNACIGTTLTLTGGGAATYLWQPANQSGSTLTVSPSTTTTYTVTGTSSQGCTASATKTITIHNPQITALATPGTVCSGSPSVLSAGGALTYTWLPGGLTGSSVSVNPPSSTTYTVTGTDLHGCTAQTILAVMVNEIPLFQSVSAQPGITCAGTNVVLEAQTQAPANTYLWQPGNLSSNTVLITAPATTSTYTVTATHANGCTATATTTLLIQQAAPVQITSTSSAICIGNSTQLQADASGNDSLFTGMTNHFSGNLAFNLRALKPVTIHTLQSYLSGGLTTLQVWYRPGGYSSPVSNSNGWIQWGNSMNLTGNGTGSLTPIPLSSPLPVNAGQTMGIAILSSANGVVLNANSAIPAGSVVASNGDLEVTNGLIISSIGNQLVNSLVKHWNGQVSYLIQDDNIYNWQPGNISGSTITVSPTSTTTYTVQGVSSNGCNTTATHTIQVNTLVTQTTLSATSTTLCNGSSTLLTAKTTHNDSLLTGTTNNFSGSIAFNILPAKNMRLTHLKSLLSGTTGTIEIWYRPGGFSSPVSTTNGWQQLGNTLFITSSFPALTPIGITSPLDIQAGQLMGIAIRSGTLGFVLNAHTSLASGNVFAANADLSVTTGNTITLFTDNLSSNIKAWQGQLSYLVEDSATYLWQPGNLTGNTISVSPSANTTYTVVSNPVNACSSSGTLQVLVNNCAPLTLKLFMEGYYLGAGQMQPVLFNQGVAGANTTQCDSITVELRNPTAPYGVAESLQTILHTDGTANLVFSQSGNYYLVVKHRNGLETWSQTPIQTNTTPNYDFTLSAAQAYGGNQRDLGNGVYGLYAGDVVIDENIDLIDLNQIDTDIANFAFGYFASDINGDGNVDLLDSPLVEANVNNFIFAIHP